MPRPLKYEPLNLTGLQRAVFFLRDFDGRIMVDTKSIIEASGMSWRSWAMVLKVRRKQFDAEPCLDRNGKETELIPASRVNQWLALVAPAASFKVAQNRLNTLKMGWRAHYSELLRADEDTSPDDERKRKITAETVHALFAARAARKSWARAAAEVGISAKAARQIGSDTYPHLPDSARAAWETTFGLTA